MIWPSVESWFSAEGFDVCLVYGRMRLFILLVDGEV